MTDPFAGDPWATDEFEDQAPAESEVSDDVESAAPAVTTTKERTISTATTEGKLVTTIKFGAGFDAPWVVIHSESPDEAVQTLADPKFRELMELTARAAKWAKTLDIGSAPAPQRGGNGQGQQWRPSTPPGTEPKRCGHTDHTGTYISHGEMIYRTGNGAKGPWAGWFCPLAKGDPNQCKPIFVKAR